MEGSFNVLQRNDGYSLTVLYGHSGVKVNNDSLFIIIISYVIINPCPAAFDVTRSQLLHVFFCKNGGRVKACLAAVRRSPFLCFCAKYFTDRTGCASRDRHVQVGKVLIY